MVFSLLELLTRIVRRYALLLGQRTCASFEQVVRKMVVSRFDVRTVICTDAHGCQCSVVGPLRADEQQIPFALWKITHAHIRSIDADTVFSVCRAESISGWLTSAM
ncbi:hypothetical protein BST37_21710 [Mycobacterium noviomagense]|uniref:Uncharacterized protein n=1 Tax=Mycobacterium noviomagense TaxID=459858 RepID=A0ABX3SZM4_9MYCO|nr:hypothetical protein BST37_21710 [Mycobacterium noviomagense]